MSNFTCLRIVPPCTALCSRSECVTMRKLCGKYAKMLTQMRTRRANLHSSRNAALFTQWIRMQLRASIMQPVISLYRRESLLDTHWHASKFNANFKHFSGSASSRTLPRLFPALAQYEVHYRCTNYKAMAVQNLWQSFWFSMVHYWTALMSFWLSRNVYLVQPTIHNARVNTLLPQHFETSKGPPPFSSIFFLKTQLMIFVCALNVLRNYIIHVIDRLSIGE